MLTFKLPSLNDEHEIVAPPSDLPIYKLPSLEEDHEIVAPTSDRPVYKPIDNQTTDDHKIVGPVYVRPKLQAEYDRKLVKDVINKSKRFNRIKPLALIKIISEQPRFGYMKKFALERLEETWQKQLSVFLNVNQCEKQDFKPDDEMSHSIFNWGWDDFLTRRRLENFVWVDVMQRTTESCLHKYKFHKDLEQLQGYVNTIFDGLFSNLGDEEIDLYQTVEKPIDEAKKVLHTTDFLEDELNANSYLHWKLVQNELFVVSIRRETEERFLKTYLENRIMNSHIWDPIEIRYNLNWFYNIVNQNHLRMDNLQESYQSDSENFKTMTLRENGIVSSCMDFFYSNIEIYKNRINAMQAKFDAELEAMDHRLDKKRNQIYKLNEQRKSLTDDIARYHKEEEIMEERERLRLEEEERLRLKAEELEAKMAAKKGPKGKGSKGGTKPKPKK